MATRSGATGAMNKTPRWGMFSIAVVMCPITLLGYKGSMHVLVLGGASHISLPFLRTYRIMCAAPIPNDGYCWRVSGTCVWVHTLTCRKGNHRLISMWRQFLRPN